MLETIETYRLGIFLGLLVLLMVFETFSPSRRWSTQRWKRLRFNGGLGAINSIMLYVLKVGPLYFLTDWAYKNNFGLASMISTTIWVEVLLSVIVLDLFDYWWHRLNHITPFLWRFHKVHHADTHVDVTTALRFHPGEMLISLGMRAVWILVWGPSVLAFTIFEIGISTAAQFHHTNIDLGRFDRWMRLVIVTPRFHANHHTLPKGTRDSNYSTIFSFWDYLFGSWIEPNVKDFDRLGLPNAPNAETAFWLNLKAPFSSKVF